MKNSPNKRICKVMAFAALGVAQVVCISAAGTEQLPTDAQRTALQEMTQRKPDAGMLQNEWRDRQRLAASQITNGSGSVQIPEGPDSILPQHAAFRHDRFMIVLRPCAVRYKFQLCIGFTRPFWPVRCRPAEGAGQLPKRTAVAGGPLRYSAIAHSCMMVSFYEPRATNHEPLFFYELRFTRGDGVILSLLPQSGILSPRRPANCELRGR